MFPYFSNLYFNSFFFICLLALSMIKIFSPESQLLIHNCLIYMHSIFYLFHFLCFFFFLIGLFCLWVVNEFPGVLSAGCLYFVVCRFVSRCRFSVSRSVICFSRVSFSSCNFFNCFYVILFFYISIFGLL